MIETVSKYSPLKHYHWGNDCDGWNLVDETNLSVKLERMPAGAAEAKHYHQQSQQFFFILKGMATFEIENDFINLSTEEGLHIKAGVIHKICNNTKDDLEFILCSQPSTINDRINCE